MKILIATSNASKFEIVSRMLKTILNGNIEISSLKDLPKYDELPEEGDNRERAKTKAFSAYENFMDLFDYIIGIDDGIIIGEEEYVAVKEHLDDIIFGDVKIGTSIYITRAYHMISKDGKEYSCFNKIPYVLIKKLDNCDYEGYPLNNVLSTIESDCSLTSMSAEELNDYFIKYSLDDLKELTLDITEGGE